MVEGLSDVDGVKPDASDCDVGAAFLGFSVNWEEGYSSRELDTTAAAADG